MKARRDWQPGLGGLSTLISQYASTSLSLSSSSDWAIMPQNPPAPGYRSISDCCRSGGSKVEAAQWCDRFQKAQFLEDGKLWSDTRQLHAAPAVYQAPPQRLPPCVRLSGLDEPAPAGISMARSPGGNPFRECITATASIYQRALLPAEQPSPASPLALWRRVWHITWAIIRRVRQDK
jgi:hypothetical protein